MLAGNHGDEYPGQVAILKLMRELQPEQVAGPADPDPRAQPARRAKAATRLSPLDGKNLNRRFPGRADGTVTEMVAHYLTTVLFPLADIVIDIHTGGRSVDFYPCAHMHLVPDREQRRQMLEGTLAWNSRLRVPLHRRRRHGAAARRGRTPGQDRHHHRDGRRRAGPGQRPPADAERPAQRAGPLRRAARARKQTRRGLGLPPTRWVQALDRDDYRFAPESGIYENLVDLGARWRPASPSARSISWSGPTASRSPWSRPRGGVLLATRAPSLVAQGDCVACIAHDVDPTALP